MKRSSTGLQFLFTLRTLITLVTVMLATQVWGQIPTRLIVNQGFELPVLTCSPADYHFQPQTAVYGWRTTDATSNATKTCTTTGANAPNIIEFWNSGFNGRASRSGNQMVEINAYNASFIYQDVCLLSNESVPFSAWHLRRAASGTGEQMRARIATIAGVTVSSGTTTTAGAAWTNYTGTVTNNATAGWKRYGFVAVSGGSLGNLIDDISITLRPLGDIRAFTSANVYEGVGNNLELYVNGTLLNAATITITRTGTASYPLDFTIGTPSRGSASVAAGGTITLTLPAGDYDPNVSSGSTAGLISIPYSTLSDILVEATETVTYSITAVSGGGNGNAALDIAYNISGQSAACGTAVTTASFNILDAVTDLEIVKTISTMGPVVGSVVTFTLTATNNGPAIATTVRANDILPAGYSYISHVASLGTYSNITGIWGVGALLVNQSVTLQITCSVNYPGPYTNNADITGGQYDNDLSNNSSSVTPFVPLPVNLLSFKATELDRQVKIDWSTSDDADCKYYEVQRSTTNRADWQMVWKGNCQSGPIQSAYSCIDENPASGMNYYRLLRTDDKGEMRAFDPISLQIDAQKAFNLYPNPVTGLLFVETGISNTANINFRDLNGRSIPVKSEFRDKTHVLDLSNIQPGIYFISIQSGNISETHRVVLE